MTDLEKLTKALVEFRDENMINLPDNSLLTIRKLNQVFNNTTACYKFYWFISILEIYGSGKESKITFKEIISLMIANAWYPVHYFKLSFGMFDMLSKYILEIQNILKLSMELEKEKIYQAILQTENPEILKMIYNLSLNVPYRFLSPWTSFENNTTQVLRSQFYYNNCPYSIHLDKTNYIIINPDWQAYLNENQKILLEDFSIIGQHTINELINLNPEDFRNLYRNTLSPLIQIAENMGFQTWEN